MNAMKIDAAAIGNHEYDWGVDTLQARLKQAHYPWLSANTMERSTGKSPRGPAWTCWRLAEAYRSDRLHYDHDAHLGAANHRRAVPVREGLDHHPAHAWGSPANRPDFIFVWRTRAGSATHLPRGDFRRRTHARLRLVDLIAAGHTHVPFNTSIRACPSSTRCFGGNLAVVDFWRRANGAREAQARMLTVWTDSIRADTGLVSLVERYKGQTSRVAARPVADFKFPLERRKANTPWDT